MVWLNCILRGFSSILLLGGQNINTSQLVSLFFYSIECSIIQQQKGRSSLKTTNKVSF